MRNKKIFTIVTLAWVLLGYAQPLDTITNNLQSPAVLDILSNRPIVNNRSSAKPQESKVKPRVLNRKEMFVGRQLRKRNLKPKLF